MKCSYCNDTGIYKQPNNLDLFEKIVEKEMDKGYFVNYSMAEEKAYEIVGYTEIPCPYCTKEAKQS